MLYLAAAIPIAVTVVKELSGFNPLAPLDPGPLGIALAVWIGVVASPHLHFRDILHVSRAQVFSSIRDAAIVVSNTGRITDANVSAVRLASAEGSSLRGRDLVDAWPELAARVGSFTKSEELSEFSLVTPRGRRHFDVSLSPIYTPVATT